MCPQLVPLMQPVQALCRLAELERPRVLGGLHPSTRRDASPALTSRREEPPLARKPAHFYCFIELVSAPQRGYELVATSRLTRTRTQNATPPSNRRERGGAASPQ